MGPTVIVNRNQTFYPKVTPEKLNKIIDAVIGGYVIEDYLYKDAKTNEVFAQQDDIPFFKKQNRMIFGKKQFIDPIHIYDYLSVEGYKAISKVLSSLTPEEVVSEIKASGLRGRGGAGFPTGLKWELLSKQSSAKGKISCVKLTKVNLVLIGQEFLEGNPHSIIVGMLIGAFANGAK
jgi:NADH-quinone oxidoreductase subunit F